MGILLLLNGSNGAGIEDISYSDLLALYQGESLTPGQLYRITDYKTCHYIQFTDSNGDGTGNDEEVHEGSVEPLIVLAVSSTSLSLNAYSELFPNDNIQYVITLADRVREYAASVGKGCILRREYSLNGYQRDYDFRNVVFKRWETTPSSNVFDSWLPVVGSTPVTVNAQGSELTAPNVKIGSILSIAAALGIPYQLDNIVITAGVNFAATTINNGFGGTFLVDGGFNEVDVWGLNKVGGSFSGNTIGQFSSNLISGNVTSNEVTNVSDNIIGALENNISVNISQNQLIGSSIIADNDCPEITGNTCKSIQNNVAAEINNNSNEGDILQNMAGTLNSNSCTGNIVNNIAQGLYENSNTGGIADNICMDLFSNSNGGQISHCNCQAVSNHTNSGQLFALTGGRFEAIGGTGELNLVIAAELANVTLVNSVMNHNFLASVQSRTITPTADMQNINIPTVSRYDTGDGLHKEEKLASGALSYTTISD